MEEEIEIEDLDPFGLNKEAEGWLKAEEKYFKYRLRELGWRDPSGRIPGVCETFKQKDCLTCFANVDERQ